MEPEAKRRRVNEVGRRTVKNYKRHGKPPYSYVGMIALLIRTAPEHKLSLAGILVALKDLFPFFQGEYQGWRDSVRHNLSHNDCFYMVPQVINNVVKSKKCDWAVHLNKLPLDALRKQEKSSKDTDYQYASTLNEHFGLPQIEYLLPCMKLQPRTVPQNDITPLRVPTSQVFKTPQSIRAPKKKRSFTIDSLLNSEDLKPVSLSISTPTSDALVSHVPIVTFPPTMFDNQTPESALENLRNLCNINPLSYNTSPSVSDIQYDVSKDTLFPPVRSFSDLRASSSTLFGLPSPELKHESHKHQDRYSPAQMVTYDYESPRSSTPCLNTHQERHSYTPLDTFNYGSPSNGPSMPSPVSYHNRQTNTPQQQTPNYESGSITPCSFTLPERHSSNIVSYEYGTPIYTTPETYPSGQNTSFFVMPTADCVIDLSRTPRPVSLPVLNEHYRIDPSSVDIHESNVNDLEESMNSTTWGEPRCRSASTVSSRSSSVDPYLPDHDLSTIIINPVSPLLHSRLTANSLDQSAFTPYDSGQIVTEATLQNLRIANDFGLSDILS